MKITMLAENTACSPEMEHEHGLSAYIETGKHRVLFDMGATGAFARNAERLGIDLSAVDTAVLSHGHYDHGGGLETFLELNASAPVYVSRHAFEPHYSAVDGYIGLDKSLEGNYRLVSAGDELRLDDELCICSCNAMEREYKTETWGLSMCGGGELVPEDFRHEQYLTITENGKRVLMSGCSHKGILNIVRWLRPDVLIGGFHFMKVDTLSADGRTLLDAAADTLLGYNIKYYTCHCTGLEQYAYLKERMGGALSYFAAGETIEL